MSKNLTNEIRRVRNKLKIFEMEGSGQLLIDLLRLNYLEGNGEVDITLIKSLKVKYETELNELLSKQSKFKQSSLEFKK